MSGGLVDFITSMLCPAVPVGDLTVMAVDPLTGLEIPGNVKPVMMIPQKCWLGTCTKCGWNNRFSNLPLLPVKIDDDTEVFVRACPREARLDVNTTYHQFQNMERGLNEDGTSYTQPEWTPVVTSRREFYYRLFQFMENFLPHYYKVLWHEAFDEVFMQQYKRLAYAGMPEMPQAPESMLGLFIII